MKDRIIKLVCLVMILLKIFSIIIAYRINSEVPSQENLIACQYESLLVWIAFFLYIKFPQDEKQ